jgi:hypothetical protein
MNLHNLKRKLKIIFFYLIAIFDIIKITFFLKKKKNFFLQSEGGFGLTIATPHFLNIKLGEDWVLFFGYKKERHNIEVEKLYKGRLKFFRVGNLNLPENRINFEKVVKNILKIFFNIKLISIRDYTLSFSNPDKTNCKYYLSSKESIESIAFRENKKNFYSDNYFKINFEKYFYKFNGNFKGKINFFLRGKGKKSKSKKLLEKVKDARNIEDYKLTIKFIF